MRATYMQGKVYRKLKADGPMTCLALAQFFERSTHAMGHVLGRMKAAGKVEVVGSTWRAFWRVAGDGEPTDRRGTIPIYTSRPRKTMRAYQPPPQPPCELAVCMGLPPGISRIIEMHKATERDCDNLSSGETLALKKREAA